MELTHIDPQGNAVMVDVGGKEETGRLAVAEGAIRMAPACFEAVKKGRAKKGDVLGVAQVAGIMAAKRTAELIPLCHAIPLSAVTLTFTLDDTSHAVAATCTARCHGRTGVEMEALTGVTVALLTIYDMCKAMDKAMEITGVRLVEKQGGKSGRYRRGQGTGV